MLWLRHDKPSATIAAIDVFRDRVRLLLCFDPIQNSRYSGLLLHRVKPCLFGLLKMFLFEIGAAI
jgi:hypothetical protein